MERLLTFWMKEKNITLSMHTIQVKAKALYNEVCNEIHGARIQRQFKASNGWFTKYINRHKLHRIKVTGEAAIANNKAAAKYPMELQSIIERGRYSDKQIFNLDETGLFGSAYLATHLLPKKRKLRLDIRCLKIV